MSNSISWNEDQIDEAVIAAHDNLIPAQAKPVDIEDDG